MIGLLKLVIIFDKTVSLSVGLDNLCIRSLAFKYEYISFSLKICRVQYLFSSVRPCK